MLDEFGFDVDAKGEVQFTSVHTVRANKWISLVWLHWWLQLAVIVLPLYGSWSNETQTSMQPLGYAASTSSCMCLIISKPQKKTPLMLASISNSAQTLQELLRAKARPHLTDQVDVAKARLCHENLIWNRMGVQLWIMQWDARTKKQKKYWCSCCLHMKSCTHVMCKQRPYGHPPLFDKRMKIFSFIAMTCMLITVVVLWNSSRQLRDMYKDSMQYERPEL